MVHTIDWGSCRQCQVQCYNDICFVLDLFRLPQMAGNIILLHLKKNFATSNRLHSPD